MVCYPVASFKCLEQIKIRTTVPKDNEIGIISTLLNPVIRSLKTGH